MAGRSGPPPTHRLAVRVLTALVALPLLLLVVWAGNPWVAVAAAIAAVAAVYEATTLVRNAGRASNSALTGLAMLGATAYVTLALFALALLRDAPFGLDWVLIAFLGTFATDTAAYAVGRAIGRSKMAPSVSPGKTWEGASGGLLAGAGAVLGLIALLEMPFALGPAIGLALALPVLAQVGDLAESKLKRMAGAKDSGALFPGHGGLLDRLDSLLPVFALVYYVAQDWPS